MSRIPMPLVILVLWCYVLFVTRPSEHDLKEQRGAKGNLQPWPVEILQSILWNSPLEKLPGQLDSGVVTDYTFFTVVWEPNKKNTSRHILLGALARFFVLRREDLTWTRDHDILLAIGIHIAAFACFKIFPGLAHRLFNVNKRRPWTVLLSTFNTQSTWSLLITGFMLINMGQVVRDAMPNKPQSTLVFWLLYSVIPGLATLTTGVILDRLATSLGAQGGILALAVFGTILTPKARFQLFGQLRLGCFGMFLLESVQILSFNPFRHPVSLLFEIFVVATSTVFLYKVLNPSEVFDHRRIYDLTINTFYGK